jgi:hypothetical protein
MAATILESPSVIATSISDWRSATASGMTKRVLCDPDVFNEIEAHLDLLGYSTRDDQRDVRFRGALIIAQFASQA